MRTAAIACCLAVLALCGCGGSSDEDSTQGTALQGQASPQGAEASIEGFGREAQGRDRAELLSAFHGYLDALAAEDVEAACSYLSKGLKDSLARLAPKGDGAGCVGTLAALLPPSAAAIARQQDGGEVKKIRFQGKTAFVVFRAPGAKSYQLNLVEEGGRWKLSALSASVLAPSAATLGQ